MNYIFGFFTIIIILWIYSMQFSKINCDKTFLDNIINVVRTGDLILFKGYNNYNSIFHGSYFGHIGIVYVKDSVPMLFEANGIEYTPLYDHHSKSGIYLTPLKERISKYKGKCYLKSLNTDISSEKIKTFENFVEYALENMYYNYSVLLSGIRKGLGLEKCNYGTNCGELVFLSLITLGLLPIEYYDTSVFHHLKWLCGIYELSNQYYYHDLLEIIDHPFAY